VKEETGVGVSRELVFKKRKKKRNKKREKKKTEAGLPKWAPPVERQLTSQVND
jgi:hypothetical protein